MNMSEIQNDPMTFTGSVIPTTMLSYPTLIKFSTYLHLQTIYKLPVKYVDLPVVNVEWNCFQTVDLAIWLKGR